VVTFIEIVIIKNLYLSFSFPTCYMSCSSWLHWFDHPNRLWREVISWNSSLCSFLQSPFTSSLLSAICLSLSFSWRTSTYILLIILETKFHSHTKIKQNCNFLCFNHYVLRYQRWLVVTCGMHTAKKFAGRILVGRPSADEIGVDWKEMWEGSYRNTLSR